MKTKFDSPIIASKFTKSSMLGMSREAAAGGKLTRLTVETPRRAPLVARRLK